MTTIEMFLPSNDIRLVLPTVWYHSWPILNWIQYHAQSRMLKTPCNVLNGQHVLGIPHHIPHHNTPAVTSQGCKDSGIMLSKKQLPKTFWMVKYATTLRLQQTMALCDTGQLSNPRVKITKSAGVQILFCVFKIENFATWCANTFVAIVRIMKGISNQLVPNPSHASSNWNMCHNVAQAHVST